MQKWFNGTKELLDKYHPDLLYFDDAMAPLGDAGLNIFADDHDANLRRHHGKLEAVLNTKNMPRNCSRPSFNTSSAEAQKQELYPWQTDTCIGDWHHQGCT